MALGGEITDCDDCGWQTCFRAVGCVRALAAEQGVDPQDVVDQALMRPVRALPQSELEALAKDLEQRMGVIPV